MRQKTNWFKAGGLGGTDKLHVFCWGRKAAAPASQSTISVWSDADRINEFAVVLWGSWIGVLLFACLLKLLDISWQRDKETVADNFGGFQSVFRLAGRTNASQTSVPKVTELMRPLQTKAFCSSIEQVKSTACQTIELRDAECCQIVSRSSNQTNNNAPLFCFSLDPEHFKQNTTSVPSVPVLYLWWVLQLRRGNRILPRILFFGSGLGEGSVRLSVEAGRKVPFIWDGVLKSLFACHPPRWMFPYSLPLQWLSINNPMIAKLPI